MYVCVCVCVCVCVSLFVCNNMVYFAIDTEKKFLKLCVFNELIDWAIDLMSRVFADRLEDQGSIPGRIIPKTQKVIFDAAYLNTKHYNVRIKGKVHQPTEWSKASPLFQCSSYWKRSLRVTLD